jgi:hypothetical protein
MVQDNKKADLEDEFMPDAAAEALSEARATPKRARLPAI